MPMPSHPSAERGSTQTASPFAPATTLVEALANREVSAVELADATIARIEALDGDINAVVVRDFARAREAAKTADDALARGERRPLLGLPMTVKEAINVAGLPTTWGMPRFKRWTPNQDTLAVARLKAAGAVILGKTNIAPSLADWPNHNRAASRRSGDGAVPRGSNDDRVRETTRPRARRLHTGLGRDGGGGKGDDRDLALGPRPSS